VTVVHVRRQRDGREGSDQDAAANSDADEDPNPNPDGAGDHLLLARRRGTRHAHHRLLVGYPNPGPDVVRSISSDKLTPFGTAVATVITGSGSGNATLPVAANRPPGNYYVRYECTNCPQNFYDSASTYAVVTVAPTQAPVVTVNTSYVIAGNSISVSWSGVSGATNSDVLGIVQTRFPNNAAPADSIYASSCVKTPASPPQIRTSGSCTNWAIFDGLAPDSYQIRYFRGGNIVSVASSASFYVNSVASLQADGASAVFTYRIAESVTPRPIEHPVYKGIHAYRTAPYLPASPNLVTSGPTALGGLFPRSGEPKPRFIEAGPRFECNNPPVGQSVTCITFPYATWYNGGSQTQADITTGRIYSQCTGCEYEYRVILVTDPGAVGCTTTDANGTPVVWPSCQFQAQFCCDGLGQWVNLGPRVNLGTGALPRLAIGIERNSCYAVNCAIGFSAVYDQRWWDGGDDKYGWSDFCPDSGRNAPDGHPGGQNPACTPNPSSSFTLVDGIGYQ
jgi:hypothetical protein